MITTIDEINGMKRHTVDFDGPGEAMAAVLSDAQVSTNSRTSRSSTSGDWHGTTTWEEWIGLMQNGWPEGREMIQKLSGSIFHQAVGSRRMAPKMHRSVHGFAPCVPAAIAMDPENMYNIRPTVISAPGGKIVTIVFNSFVSARCSPASVMDKGIIACALVDCLESLGYRVEFWWTDSGCARSYASYYRTRFCLKEAEDPLSLDLFATWVGHTSGQRRSGFALLEQGFPQWEAHSYSYGTPDKKSTLTNERGDLFLEGADLNEVGPEGCALMLRQHLTSLGVEFDA